MKLRRWLPLLLVLSLLVSWMMIFSVSAMEEETQPQEEETTVAPETEEATDETTKPSTEPAMEETTEATTEPEEEPTEDPTEDPEPHGSCGANLTWRFDTSSGTLTISGSGAMADSFLLPSYDFLGDVKKIVIQPGVTTIGNEAFRHCGYVSSVSIPDTVWKIGDKAFSSCHYLTSVKLPSSLTHLGKGVFFHCSNLKSINLPASVTTCGDSVFEMCQSLQTIKIPSGWTQIPSGMFMQTALAEITIPASVNSIGASVFWSCPNLSVIKFEGDAPNFHASAFSNQQVTCTYPANNSTWTKDKMNDYGGEITWLPDSGNGVQVGGTFGMNNMQWKLDGSTLYITGNGYMNGWNGGEKPPWYAYRGSIQKVVMSGNIEDIWSDSFRDCVNLSEFVWPTGVITIFGGAFANCTSLKRITVPSSVRTIDAYAFSGCGAASITLSNGLKRIGQAAFSSCSQLQSLTIPATVTEISGGAFCYCESLRTIYFTGNMPFMSINEPYLPWTFGDIYNVVVYYPGNNSTWTAAKLQVLSKQHQPQGIVFKTTTSETVEQPTEGGAIPDSTQKTENGTTPQGNQEATVPETTTVPVPEASVPEGTVNTEPSVEPMETVEQETNTQPTKVTTDRSEKKPKTAVWITTASVGALIAATAGTYIVLKKKGKIGK